MTSPHINTVREHLLETLAALRNREAPMDVDRARAVAQVAGVLIDSAKVEVDFIKATGQDSSEFFEAGGGLVRLPGSSDKPTPHNPFPVSARNRAG
jgi:hypothetical protein